jgi:predicted PurR-regulated permease PerM
MSAARTLQFIAVAAAILLILWLLADVLLLVFLAILIAAILRALARWTSRKTHLPEPAALACVTLVMLALLGLLLRYLGPLLVVQGEAMWQSVLHQIDAIRSTDGHTDWAQWILKRLTAWTAVGGPLATSARSFITLTTSGLVEVLVMCVTALYFAIDPDLYVGGVVRLMPKKYRARGRQILLDAGRALVSWSAGQFVDMVVVGTMAAIGFTALHLPLAFGLAVLAGLLTFVPVLGAIFAAIPALIVGLAAGWHTAVWVVVVFLCCHVVEAYVVGPAVQRRMVRLPPALTILSMTCLGSIFGLLGVVLGAPLAAVLLVVIREAYVGEVLGDSGA